MRLPPRDRRRVVAASADHMLCVGASAMELAAFTPMLYLIEGRELMLDLIDALCGARVTTNFVRIGGVSADMPEGFATSRCRGSTRRSSWSTTPTSCSRIIRSSAAGWRAPAICSPKDLVAWGVTGPMLRAGGVPYDIRRVASVSRLQRSRFRGSGRRAQRQFRSLPRAHGRDAAEPQHDSAMLRQASRRARSMPTIRACVGPPRAAFSTAWKS